MMNSDSCNECTKIVVHLAPLAPMGTLLDVPNTFNRVSQTFCWNTFDTVAYALVPQSQRKEEVLVDLYLCLDEDDLDDIDLPHFVARLLQENVLVRWRQFILLRFSEPEWIPPTGIGCHREEPAFPADAHSE